jgi:hypothetical protein
MAILGALVKSALNFSKQFSTGDSPAEMQIIELERLLRKAEHTSFGKYYNFSKILRSSNMVQGYRHSTLGADDAKSHSSTLSIKKHS